MIEEIEPREESDNDSDKFLDLDQDEDFEPSEEDLLNELYKPLKTSKKKPRDRKNIKKREVPFISTVQKMARVFGKPLSRLKPKKHPLEIDVIRHWMHLYERKREGKWGVGQRNRLIIIQELRKAVIENWPVKHPKFRKKIFAKFMDDYLENFLQRLDVIRHWIHLHPTKDDWIQMKRKEFETKFDDIMKFMPELDNAKEKPPPVKKAKIKLKATKNVLKTIEIVAGSRKRKVPKRYAIEELEKVNYCY